MNNEEEIKLFNLEREIKKRVKKVKKDYIDNYATLDEENKIHFTEKFKEEYRVKDLGISNALYFFLIDLKKELGEKD